LIAHFNPPLLFPLNRHIEDCSTSLLVTFIAAKHESNFFLSIPDVSRRKGYNRNLAASFLRAEGFASSEVIVLDELREPKKDTLESKSFHL
jgi:hypothetical protein